MIQNVINNQYIGWYINAEVINDMAKSNSIEIISQNEVSVLYLNNRTNKISK